MGEHALPPAPVRGHVCLSVRARGRPRVPTLRRSHLQGCCDDAFPGGIRIDHTYSSTSACLHLGSAATSPHLDRCTRLCVRAIWSTCRTGCNVWRALLQAGLCTVWKRTTAMAQRQSQHCQIRRCLVTLEAEVCGQMLIRAVKQLDSVHSVVKARVYCLSCAAAIAAMGRSPCQWYLHCTAPGNDPARIVPLAGGCGLGCKPRVPRTRRPDSRVPDMPRISFGNLMISQSLSGVARAKLLHSPLSRALQGNTYTLPRCRRPCCRRRPSPASSWLPSRCR